MSLVTLLLGAASVLATNEWRSGKLSPLVVSVIPLLNVRFSTATSSSLWQEGKQAFSFSLLTNGEQPWFTASPVVINVWMHWSTVSTACTGGYMLCNVTSMLVVFMRTKQYTEIIAIHTTQLSHMRLVRCAWKPSCLLLGRRKDVYHCQTLAMFPNSKKNYSDQYVTN